MTKQKKVEYALVNLLEWAKGNRGPKNINPYAVPEINMALATLTKLWGRVDYLQVDQALEYQALDKPNNRRFT